MMDEETQDEPTRRELTQAEIMAECERIRAGWDPRTEAMRIADDRYQHEALQRLGLEGVYFQQVHAPPGFE